MTPSPVLFSDGLPRRRADFFGVVLSIFFEMDALPGALAESDAGRTISPPQEGLLSTSSLFQDRGNCLGGHLVFSTSSPPRWYYFCTVVAGIRSPWPTSRIGSSAPRDEGLMSLSAPRSVSPWHGKFFT